PIAIRIIVSTLHVIANDIFERSRAAVVKVRRSQLNIAKRRSSKSADVQGVAADYEATQLSGPFVTRQRRHSAAALIFCYGGCAPSKRVEAAKARGYSGVSVVSVCEKRESCEGSEVLIERVANSTAGLAAEQQQAGSLRLVERVQVAGKIAIER